MSPSDPSDRDLPPLDPEDFSEVTDLGVDVKSLIEENQKEKPQAPRRDAPPFSRPGLKVPSFGRKPEGASASPRSVRLGPSTAGPGIRGGRSLGDRAGRLSPLQSTLRKAEAGPKANPAPQEDAAQKAAEEAQKALEARLAEEAKRAQEEALRAEQERLAQEEAQRAQEEALRAEEEARLAEEKKALEEHLALEARLAQESQKAQEEPQISPEALLLADDEAIEAHLSFEARLDQEEDEEAQKAALQAEEEDRRAQEEEARLLAEKAQQEQEEALRAEQERLAQEEAQRAQEEALRAEQEKKAQEEKLAQEAKKAQEEHRKAQQEARKVQEAKQAQVAPVEEDTWQTNHELFKEEVRKLVRGRKWQELTVFTQTALMEGRWARLPEARASLLLDLARLYQDRLRDEKSAEEAFRLLLEVDPSNREAIEYLDKALRARGDWRTLHQIYAAAIEPVWDPKHRLEWTREAARIATEKLADPELATADWERLWRLGDATQEALTELNRAYRAFGRWERLAEFLTERAGRLEGAARILALREVGELYLSALRDHEKAAPILEEIFSARPDDPIARLAWARVLVRRKDFAALEALTDNIDPVGDSSGVDLARLVADALWQAEEYERAIKVYERLLQSIPSDEEALRAKEEHLARTQQYEALCSFLVERADREEDVSEKVALLEKAARYAERELIDLPRAAELLERAISLDPTRDRIYANLGEIYESLGDLEGVARALEGQLKVTSASEPRVALLRRLGEHYAHRLGDDEKAETFWREILTLIPRDDQVEDELLALHRRRGQFEALDAALLRQIWRTPDPERALSKAREAARFCTEALEDPARSLEAWLRLLDLAPDDPEALGALVTHWSQYGTPRDAIAATEATLRVSQEKEEKLKGALENARRWEELEAPLLALASYERALALNPTSEEALSGLLRLRGAKEAGAAISALDVASAALTDPTARIATLRRALDILPEDASVARFELARRILWLSEEPSDAMLEELTALAKKAGLHAELAAAMTRLAANAKSQEARLRYRKEISRIAREDLENPARAFLELLSVGLDAAHLTSVTESFVALAEATGRYEDLLALWESFARPEFPPTERRKAIAARATICEQKLNDPERAFWEWRRILELDPDDQAARDELHRLAEEKGLWRQLDAVYGELWDGANEVSVRVALYRTRHLIRREHLKDPLAAVDALVAICRLAPETAGIKDDLFAAAEETGAWGRVLPLLEGIARAQDKPSPIELARLARLYEEKCESPEHAFMLYQEAFALDPESLELEGHVERLAEKTGAYERLGEALRRVAALSIDKTRALALYRRVAEIYEQKLQAPQRAIEVHRRILNLDPGALSSLEVLIEAQRRRKEWQELRDLLRQWIQLAPPEASRSEKWLEIAEISQEHLKDTEGALAALAEVLDLDPQNTEAERRIKSIMEDNSDPTLQLKHLRIELARAQGPQRVDLFLSLAKVQENLGEIDQAIETLRALISEFGVESPGTLTLERLYRAQGRFSDLADLLEARAAAESDVERRLGLLEQAIVVRGEQPASDDAALERLYRKLLADRPHDEDARGKLAAILRSAGRYQELAALLAETSPRLDRETRLELLRERGRLLRSLGETERANEVFETLLAEVPEDITTLITLSVDRAARKDFDGYVEIRRRQARTLPPKAAAFVLCHLAEYADEAGQPPARVSAFYREARQIDPENDLATEALKSLGRRSRGWRAAAALLPDPDEKGLSPQERAARLVARGQKAEPKEAALWYWKAVAVDPSSVDAWDALAETLKETKPEQAYIASLAGLAAYEATVPPSPQHSREHAERVFRISTLARSLQGEAAARRLASQAHRLDPSFGPATVMVADEALDRGDILEAYTLYDRTLERGEGLDERSRLHAIYRRGILARRENRKDRAVQDLRATLRANPLHAEALAALAEILTEEGRYSAAAQHHIQALLVEGEPQARGRRYFALGRLLEDRLGAPEEAGISYDLSLSLGVSERDLIVRALRYYQNIGDRERALHTLNALLDTTEEPRELASLWTTRGQLETDPDRAIEAFDMALSYEPGKKEALAGLAKILEARGEWEQLLDIYEARLEGGSPQERADALRQMARISQDSLGDPERAEGYLQQIVEIGPTREDLQNLLTLYGDGPERRDERRDIQGRLVAFGPPWYSQALDFARLLQEDGARAWTWCILSLMSQMPFPEASFKVALQELRKEYEKKDNLEALRPSLHDELRASEEDPALTGVLAELDGKLSSFGWQTPEEAGATGASRIDERTSAGRLFRQISNALGMEDSTSMRAQELPEPVMVLAQSPHQILVRGEILQSLSSGDLAFVFAFALDLSAPGRRLLAGAKASDREALIGALFQAVGLESGESALAARIREATDEDTRSAWAERLRHLAGQSGVLGKRHYAGILKTARRVGMVAAGDLRMASRAISRLHEEEAIKPQGFTKVSELEEHLENAPILREMLAFVCTPAFGKLLV